MALPKNSRPTHTAFSITTASLSSHHGALHLYTCIVVQTVLQALDSQSPVSTSDSQHPAFRPWPRPHAALSTLSPSSPRVPDQSLLAFQPQVSPVLLGPDHGRQVHLRTLHLRPRIAARPAGLPARAPSSTSASASISQSTAGLVQHPTTPQNQSSARRQRHISLASPTRPHTSTAVPRARQSSCRHVFRQCLGLAPEPASAAPERGLSKACHRALPHEQPEI